MVERWIIEQRRKICGRCERVKACPHIPTIFREVTACPLGVHPTRDAEVAARAWPAGAPPVSGCCDRIE